MASAFSNALIIIIPINSCKLQLKDHVNPLILPVQVGRVNTRRKSGIPRSTGTSREASPSRYGAARGVRAAHGRPGARPLLTEQILRQSQEAESALADALVSPYESSWSSSFNMALTSLAWHEHIFHNVIKSRNSHRCHFHNIKLSLIIFYISKFHP